MKPSALLLVAFLLSSQSGSIVTAQTPAPVRSTEALPADGTEPSAGTQRVLALYWYPSDHPVTVTFDRQFHTELNQQSAGTVERFAEYFESGRFPGESQAHILRDYLRLKYADRKIDVLFAWGSVPLEFLLKYRRDLFPDTPIVFYVGTLEATRQYTEPALTGVTNPDAYEK